MSVIQKGIGVAWGVSSSGFTYTASATVLKVVPTGQSFRKTSKNFECSNKDGETNGKVFFDQRQTLTLRCYPSDTTLALANTANVLPAPGDKFVVTDANDPDIAGTYVVEECGKERVNNGITTFDITIIEYVADISATIS